MQEEVTKHTKKIYDTLKNPKHTFGEKVKEVIIEILIIVFAVTLSIWLHGWNGHRHQQAEVQEFFSDLKVDLKNDVKDLKEQNDYLNITSKNCSVVKNLSTNKVDSISQLKDEDKIYLNLNPIAKIRNTGNYEGFISSGKIGLIENRTLKILILNYYQKTVPAKAEFQSFYNSLILDLAKEVNATSYENIMKFISTSDKAKGILANCEVQAKQIVGVNNNVIEKVNEILAVLDKEEKE